MRLNCEILVVNRVAGSLNMRTLSKPTRASVAIGRKESLKTHIGGKEITVFLLICTAKEKNGTKYKIKENLLQVFTKFLENGKATIRLKEPPHDLLISKADPTNLKALLSILKLGDHDLPKANLSCLVPAKSSDLEKPKTDMVITRRGDYPLGKPFPSELQRLAVRDCGLLRIDLRILQLKRLTSLSLPGNQIKELPLRLSKLSTLSELVLNGNRIKEFPPTLCYGGLASSLKLLDLSQNEIKLLPVGFCSFRNLVHLKLDGNDLHMLPINIGSLSYLRFFSASCNKLKVLPYSMLGLRLESVDVSENPFLLPDKLHTVNNLTVPSLMECAGIVLKKYRCQYSKGCIPASLSVFMDTIKQCPCGNYCFNSCVHYLVTMNLYQVAHTVVSKCQTLNYIPAEGYLCSWNCLRKFQNSKSHH